MAKTTGKTPSTTTRSPEERIAIALERIADALARAPGTLNAPTGPIPPYAPPSAKEPPVGTLSEEMARLHATVEKQKAAAKPKPEPAPEPKEPEGPQATFKDAREALVAYAGKNGSEKALAILRKDFNVNRLTELKQPDEDVDSPRLRALYGRLVQRMTV